MAMIEKIYETTGPEETLQIGKQIGESAAAGEVYALIGDLGVGKTVFTKGFAEGLGIDEPVNSPTCRFMKKEGYLSTTSTCTGSKNRRRWRRSVLMNI